jgi:ribosomal protein L13
MKTANKCYLARTEDVQPQWWVVDASDQVLGRLAVRIANVLMGKHKPTYTPNVDTGDFVIVLNAGSVKITGANKREQVVYQSYSGYPGGQKVWTMNQMLERPGARAGGGGAAHAAEERARAQDAAETEALQRQRASAPGADARALAALIRYLRCIAGCTG